MAAAEYISTNQQHDEGIASIHYNRKSEDPVKNAINIWLAETAATAMTTCFSAPLSSPWALILETDSLITLRSLERHPWGEVSDSIVACRTVIPNPEPATCAAIESKAPGTKIFPVSSHQLLDDLAGNQGEISRSLKNSGFHGAFSFVWLDYCGTFDSKPGRKRQKDIEHLIVGGLLAHRSVLAITFATRGSPELYEHESVDRVVHFVETLTEIHHKSEMVVQLIGVVTYGADTQGLLAKHQRESSHVSAPLEVFTVVFNCCNAATSSAMASAASTPLNMSQICYPKPRTTPGLKHYHAIDWRTASVRSGKKSPLLNALERVAADFSGWTERFYLKDALVMDSRLAVNSRALLRTGSSGHVTTLLPKGANRGLALTLLELESRNEQDVEVAAAATSLHTLIDSLRERRGTVGSVFLDYGNNKPFTASALRGCSEWSDLNKVLESGLFNTERPLSDHGGSSMKKPAQCNQVIGILVNVTEADDYWAHITVDWIVRGFTTAVQRHLPSVVVTVCQVTCFVSPVARVSVVFSLGVDVLVIEPCLTQAHVDVAGWFTLRGWDLNRPKQITPQHKKKFEGISKIIAAVVSESKSRSICVHEPGFLLVLPTVLDCCSSMKKIWLLTDDSRSMVEREHACLVATGDCRCQIASLSSVLESNFPDTLLLLSDGSAISWRKMWMCSVLAWLSQPDSLTTTRTLVLLCESIDGHALKNLSQDLIVASEGFWDTQAHEEKHYAACSRKLVLVSFVFTVKTPSSEKKRFRKEITPEVLNTKGCVRCDGIDARGAAEKLGDTASPSQVSAPHN